MKREVRNQIGIIAVLGAVLLPLPLLPRTGTIVDFMMNALILIVLAESWNFLAGFGGQISLGAAAFFGVGAYVLSVSLVWYSLSPILALPLAGAAAAGLSALVAVPLFRLRQDVFAIGTLGFSLILGILVLYSEPLGGFSGFPIVGTTYDIKADYYMALISAVLIIIAIIAILSTRFGFGLIAIREDEDVAESMGVPVLKYKVMAFAISSFFAGIAGGIYALYIFHVSSDLFGVAWTANAVVISIVGGVGTIAGPAIMSVIYVLLQNYILANFPVVDSFVYGILLIAVVILLPNGLMSVYRKEKGSRSIILEKLLGPEKSNDALKKAPAPSE